MTLRVCVVDGDAIETSRLSRWLAGQGYRVSRYGRLGPFLDKLSRRRPQVLFLDMHMPGVEGREIFRALRCDPANRGMILIGLSSQRSRDELVAAFEAGADEYFVKPLDAALVVVRLASLLRRVPTPLEEEVFQFGRILLHPGSRVCRVEEKGVRLSRLEFDLLLRFVQNPGRVFTRGNLIDTLWRGDAGHGQRAVDRHIHALRVKLGVQGRSLETLVGIGYCLRSAA